MDSLINSDKFKEAVELMADKLIKKITELNTSINNHTHEYAGSSSAGGAAISADKLNTDAGSATQPVYFVNGIPVATTHSLNKTVPADAVFTDTTYTSLKNPYALTLQCNGTTLDTYDGSEAKTLNITSSNINAAPKATLLYDNVSGDNTSESITLNDDISNYDMVEILYGRDWGYSSVKVPTASLKDILMQMTYFTAGRVIFCSGVCELSGQTLLRGTKRTTGNPQIECIMVQDFYTSGELTVTDTVYTASTGFALYIYRVIGYKDED